MSSAAVVGTAPAQRVWQRSGSRGGSTWVLVGEPQEDSVLHGPPIDRVIGTTSHRSSGVRPATCRRISRSVSPSWLWTVRWYRARWAARRALRSR